MFRDSQFHKPVYRAKRPRSSNIRRTICSPLVMNDLGHARLMMRAGHESYTLHDKTVNTSE